MIKMSKEEYDQEPIDYCINCFDIGAKKIDGLEIDVCPKCGNTKFATAKNVEEWNIIYVKEHGHLFLNENEEY